MATAEKKARPARAIRPKIKAARLDIRTSEQVKNLLAQAAELRDRSVTDFVLESAAAAARLVIEEESRLAIPLRQWKAFNEALEARPKRIPRLSRLFKEKSFFER
jgi:uncharacterized protein (DUF1778 family)